MAYEQPFQDTGSATSVSVIICTRNRSDSLLAVLGGLYEQEGLDTLSWEILVVDNGSTDNTAVRVHDWIAAGHSSTRYLHESKIGKALALNKGIEAARGSVLVFTDDDVILTKGWLKAILLAFAKHGCIGIGGRLLPDFRPEPPAWYQPSFPFPYKFDFGKDTKPLTSPPFGVNMAFRREAFRQYGTFRTDLGPHAKNPTGKGEDSEFGSRLIQAGESIMYVPDALLYHPLDARLITRKFMHRWYYQYGMSEVLRSPHTLVGPDYFGIPRHLFRTLVTSYFKRMFSIDPRVRYLSEMEIHRIRGVIAGFSNKAATHEPRP